MSVPRGNWRTSLRGGRTPLPMRRSWDDRPAVPERGPQGEPPEEEVEFSPQCNQGAARGRRDKVTPAPVRYRVVVVEEVNLRRELNLREA